MCETRVCDCSETLVFLKIGSPGVVHHAAGSYSILSWVLTALFFPVSLFMGIAVDAEQWGRVTSLVQLILGDWTYNLEFESNTLVT